MEIVAYNLLVKDWSMSHNIFLPKNSMKRVFLIFLFDNF